MVALDVTFWREEHKIRADKNWEYFQFGSFSITNAFKTQIGTKMGDDSLAEATTNAPNFICPIYLLKPKKRKLKVS
mgnify:CR=1 FL=1